MAKAEKYLALLLLSLFGLIAGLPVFWPAATEPASAAPAYETSGPTIKREKLTIDTTGADGGASGSATTDAVMTGRIVRVDVDFAAGITTTTDLTLAQANDLIATNIVSLSDTITDTQLFPTIQITDNAGTGRTYDGTRPVVDYYPVADELTVTIAQTTAATPAVTIDIYYEE